MLTSIEKKKLIIKQILLNNIYPKFLKIINGTKKKKKSLHPILFVEK